LGVVGADKRGVLEVGAKGLFEDFVVDVVVVPVLDEGASELLAEPAGWAEDVSGILVSAAAAAGHAAACERCATNLMAGKHCGQWPMPRVDGRRNVRAGS
jgi:hypothetical protein